MGFFQQGTLMDVVLAGVALYFSVRVFLALWSWLLYLKLRPTALITWPRPVRGVPLLVALGLLAAGVAILNGYKQRPFHHVYSQGITALYFLLMVPMLVRIPLGLYEDGVWADRGFLPYDRIGRMAFQESPEIVLMLVPKGGSGSLRLRVPPDEYGAVRKVLEDKIRSRVLKVESAILGLEEE